VDIVKQKLHFIDLDSGPSSHKSKDIDISVGHPADIERDSNHFFFGGKHGFGKMNRESGEYRIIKRYWEGYPDQAEREKKFRGNDGAVDARGRYWFGMMRDPLVNDPSNDGKCKTYQGLLCKADDDMQVSCFALILIYRCTG
jgi:sugar lactone lactonase YvrE